MLLLLSRVDSQLFPKPVDQRHCCSDPASCECAFIGNSFFVIPFNMLWHCTRFTRALLASHEQCSAKYVKVGTSKTELELGCNILTPCITPLFSVERLKFTDIPVCVTDFAHINSD